MKYILSFLFFCLVFHCIQANEDRKRILKKMNFAALTLKKMLKAKKEKMRKLQKTDLDEKIPLKTVPTDIPADSPVIARATPVSNVSAVQPVSTDEVNSTTTSGFIAKRFHNFESAENGVQFNLLMSFIYTLITRTINMRLLVTYNSRVLRILPIKAGESGDSVPTTCEIKDEFKDLVGTEGKGENIDYECTAPTSGTVSSAVIDTSSEMLVGTKQISVDDVSFTKESEVRDLTKATSYAFVLNKTTVDISDDKKLILKGNIIPKEDADKISTSKAYKMNFYDTSLDEEKTLNCKVTELKDGDCTLECDTESKQITTNYGNLTLSKIDEGNIYLTVNPDLDNHKSEEIISSTPLSGRNTFYRNSSSGLSGGAIAGIVIACVVALAAASIAAIMLRKPAPPIDQTTVVGLKTVENM